MDRIAFFIPDMRVGGAEKTVLNLLKGMHAQGLMTDLVVINNGGIYNKEIPGTVRIINLHNRRVGAAVFSLAGYLRKHKPRVLISHLSHCNVVALLANKIAGSITPVIVVEHSILSGSVFRLKHRLLLWLMKKLYPSAGSVVAVAKKTAEDVELTLALKKSSVHPIYNPVSMEEVFLKSAARPLHPWLEQKEIPLYLAVGRLVPEKDFKTLLDAFSLVRKKMNARLILLGDGVLLPELQQQVLSLGIDKDVSLPGFTENPYAFMAAADLLVVSSVREGFSIVLIEAMTCGCNVISTDCPEGPSEILEDGKFGRLVTPGDSAALAEAMIQSLQSPVDKQLLIDRASYFSVEKAVGGYLNLIDEVVNNASIKK
jgi:glycosyltransferase involved in cell wall biosynthesis